MAGRCQRWYTLPRVVLVTEFFFPFRCLLYKLVTSICSPGDNSVYAPLMTIIWVSIRLPYAFRQVAQERIRVPPQYAPFGH